MSSRRQLVLTGLAGVASYAAVQRAARTWGSTPVERRSRLPGDALVPDAPVVTDHARTVAAPPHAVWPWLTQVGWHLGGWYTPRWVDRLLFPDNWPSLDHLDPTLTRRLAVGDLIPDGPPGTAVFVVEQVEPERVLLLRSTTHLPPSWADRAAMEWTWCFVLTPTSDGGTRVHLRVRGRTSPWWLTLLYTALVVPADLVMAPGMLRGLDRRATHPGPPGVSGRAPYAGVTS